MKRRIRFGDFAGPGSPLSTRSATAFDGFDTEDLDVLVAGLDDFLCGQDDVDGLRFDVADTLETLQGADTLLETTQETAK